MVNYVQIYISSIQSITSEDTVKELIDFCNKWFNETSDRIAVPDLDRILTKLSPASYTAGFIYAAAARLSKTHLDSELIEFLGRLSESIFTFTNVQIQWVQDIYFYFFQNLTEELIRRGLEINGVKLLSTAILKLTNNSTSLLTNLHALLFCLCLKARRFDAAIPFFKINVTDIFLSAPNYNVPNAEANQSSLSQASLNLVGPSFSTADTSANADNDNVIVSALVAQQNVVKIGLDTRQVLLYFYYGAMILTVLERYEEALLLLEHAISLPAARLSLIIVAALKKYVLISLILGRSKPSENLPNYISTIIQRQAFPLCQTYFKLSDIYHKYIETRRNVTLAVETFIQQKVDDSNYGLVKRVLIAAKEDSIKRLGNIFISLHLNEVSRMSFVNINEETEEIARRLCYQNRYNVRIDQNTKTFRFAADPNSDQQSVSSLNQEQVEFVMLNVIKLRELIGNFDDAVRLSHSYIAKNVRTTAREGLSGLVYPEDEGFQNINNLYSLSP